MWAGIAIPALRLFLRQAAAVHYTPLQLSYISGLELDSAGNLHAAGAPSTQR